MTAYTSTLDSDIRSEVVSTVRRLLERRSDSEAVRKAVETDSGHDPAVWATLAEIGLQGILVPENQGGSGGSFVDAATILAELGEHLYPGPILGSAILAPTALLAVADLSTPERWLPQLADGSVTAAVISATEGNVEFRDSCDSGLVLNGSADFVVDAGRADVLLVDCSPPDHARVAMVRTDDQRVTVDRRRTHDITRDLASVRFDEVHVAADDVVNGDISPVLMRQRIFEAGAAALAADSLGIGRRVLQMSVEYAKTRHQFGRAIGSFQAIKHMCADMFVAVQASRAAVDAAAHEIAVDPAASAKAASIAKSQAGQAAVRIAGDAIQLHGGIGYTWEHDCHLYLKRAKLNAALFGTTREHHERIVDLDRVKRPPRPNSASSGGPTSSSGRDSVLESRSERSRNV